MAKPKIRFNGYTEDWEQRKLEELGSLKNGMNFSKEAMGIGFPFVNLQNIFGNNVIDVTNLGKAMASDSQLKDYNLLNGDVLFVRSSVKLEGVGEAALVPQNLENTTYSGFIIRFRDEYGLDNNFKRFLFGIEFVRNQIMAQATNSANKNISQTVLENLCLKIPKKSEQEKIGLYFSNLDHLITLHQRKCEQTKTLKKYMLQKMFPQDGEKVPQIRFEGFTEDWEQRKLGDVFEQTSNLVNPKEDEIELWSLTVEDGLTKKSDRYNREFLVKKDDNFKEVRPGDIVYNPMNMTLGAVGYNGMAKSVAVSGYYTTMVAKENYDTYYINTWLKSPQAIRLYRTYATGSLIEKQRVQFPTLSIIPVAFPKYEEQTKIGNYFHFLDNLITLHQRKCDELKEVKKFMLQNMFV